MAELLKDDSIKVIAYYLPQFHSIPENDKAWGKGFTEWTNVRKSRPLFDGHYQPKVPLGENYYNLLDDEVKVWQSNLAQKYKVFGFCYYHYWFKNGKKLLEKPAEQMLRNKEITIPFCFSWANENWSKRWDGGNQEVIAEQDYGSEKDWEAHLEYLLPFFKDDRYITLDGKPVFVIYKPEEIPNVNKMLNYWNMEIRKYGFSGICFMIQNPNWFFMPSYDMGEFSYQIKFHPFFALGCKGKDMERIRLQRHIYAKLKKLHINGVFDYLYKKARSYHHQSDSDYQKKLDYDNVWETILNSEAKSEYIEGAFVDWDNSARKKNGYVNIGTTSEKFGVYMKRLFKKIKQTEQLPVVFLNAWNEWCEGAYLEPDELHKYSYLEAIRSLYDE